MGIGPDEMIGCLPSQLESLVYRIWTGDWNFTIPWGKPWGREPWKLKGKPWKGNTRGFNPSGTGAGHMDATNGRPALSLGPFPEIVSPALIDGRGGFHL
jgi:hypothetical protein